MRLSFKFSYLLLRTALCTGAHNLSCSRNEDDNIHDDVKCVKHKSQQSRWFCGVSVAIFVWKIANFFFFLIRVSFRSLKFTFFFWSDEFQLLFSFKPFFVCIIRMLLFSLSFHRCCCCCCHCCGAFLPVRKLNTRWSISNISRTKSNDTKTETILFAFFCSVFSRDCCWWIIFFFSLRYFH